MQSFLSNDEIPIELLPHKHRLSPRFFELRKQLVEFLSEVILPRRQEYAYERKRLEEKESDPLKAPQPAILKELQAEAKKRGLWNLFLPEVSGLSVVRMIVSDFRPSTHDR